MAGNPDEARRTLINVRRDPPDASWLRMLANKWHVDVERLVQTERSLLAFGYRHRLPVVIKVAVNASDEQRAGEILEAFQGHGTVRVYEHVEGAILLEWLRPGRSLTGMALSGADLEATGVLADTIRAMSPQRPVAGVATVQDWGASFVRYGAAGDTQIQEALVKQAHREYQRLCESQRTVRLLHGDLHHDNVLFDSERGWLAIDPKGVMGELEFEIGTALRNPHERADLYATPAIIEGRAVRFSRELGLDTTRVLSWTFAQAVLASIWAIEDGETIEPAWMRIANQTRSILGSRL